MPALQSVLQSLTLSALTTHTSSTSLSASVVVEAIHWEYHSFCTTHVVPDTQVPFPVHPWPPHWQYSPRVPELVAVEIGAEIIEEELDTATEVTVVEIEDFT
jgi:hypothetical protein